MGRDPGGADLEGIEAVYRQRLPDMRRVATAIAGSREAALDAVQDAFARAIRQRDTFRGDGSLEAWIWRIVVNTARTAAAARVALRLDLDALPESGDTDDRVEASPVQVLVRGLPERQRLALFLRYYADLDYGTIADALEVAPGTVAATLSQARDSLRAALKEVPR
jgi:RNA polymerase sigma-70 factor (ECF subfamily)